MNSAARTIGILGARSLVGGHLIKMLEAHGLRVLACSRKEGRETGSGVVTWHRLAAPATAAAVPAGVGVWVSLMPIIALIPWLPSLEQPGIRRVVAVSTTSRYARKNSPDPIEQLHARRIEEAEAAFIAWAEARNVEWVILRPTLIYGGGLDRNVASIARFLRRFHFFPILGDANGMRQPLHVEDVAAACVACVEREEVAGKSFDISGGETLSYRAMVERVARTMGRKPRLVRVPRWLVVAAVNSLRCLPGGHKWSVGMADRMNYDQTFTHDEARAAFGFSPRPFVLGELDVR